MSRLHAPLLAALAAASAASAAEPSLDSVTVEARLEAGRPPSVSMSYFVRPAGAPAVPFGSLRFGDSRVANVRAFLGERELSFKAAAAGESRVDGHVDLPAEAGAVDRLHLRLVYEVLPEPALGPGTFTLDLPLLVVGWPPSETRPETFQATVHLPAGIALHAAFPSEFTRIDPVERTAAGSAHRFVLPVVPALIRLRAGTGEPPLLTAERAVDAGAVALLVLLAAAGWGRMRRALE